MQRFHKDDMLELVSSPIYGDPGCYLSAPCSLGTRTVAVRTGKESKHEDFTVHETLIKKTSEFMRATLNGEWKESKDRLIKLPDVEPANFRLYVQWLYTERLHTITPGDPTSLGSAIAEEIKELYLLVDLYILGNYILDNTFMDTVSDAIVRWSQQMGSFRSRAAVWAHGPAYKKLPATSPLRRLLPDIAAWALNEVDIHNSLHYKPEDHDPDFLRDIVRAMATRIYSKGKPPLATSKGTCHYHCHGEEPCYRAKQNA